jgi:glycosyltransferase involved in cell wall biosynthesis/GT2 family glycosyltransferase
MTEEDERRRLLARVPPRVVSSGFLMSGECLQSESLSVVNRHLCLELAALGVEVCAESSERRGGTEPRFLALMRRHLVTATQHAVQWCSSLPPAFVDDARLRILFDMCDSWRCCQPRYPGKRDGVDLVATGSNYSANVLERYGVPSEKLLVLPLGVDTTVFHPGVPPLDLRRVKWENLDAGPAEAGHYERFKFLFLAQGQPRKGLEPLLLAYEQVGTADTLLLVKCNNRRWGRDPGEIIRGWLARGKRPPIAWTSELLTEAETAGLIRAADCLVAPHLVEGFGLVPLQALACGTPVIVSDDGGPTEYATPENALLLRGTRHTDAHYDIPAGFGYFEPDREHLAELLEYAAGGADLQSQRAAGLRTAAKWTWRRTAEMLLEEGIESRGVPLARTRHTQRKRTPGLVSIVIACRDGGEQLRRYLASLRRCTSHYELIVVDDASDPPLLWQPGGHDPGPHQTWLRTEAKCTAAARNVGFERAAGEWICACDCDLEAVDPEWIDRLVRCAQETGACIVGPALLLRDGEHIDEAGHDLAEGVPRPLWHGALWEPRPAEQVAYVSGAVHLFRAELLDLTGGMWPEYAPTLWDDVDFCYHARALTGRPIVCCHAARVIHHRGSFTLSAEGRAAYGRNRELFERYWG